MEMNQLILSLGSNIESRSLNITNACQAIAREIGKISISFVIHSLINTAPGSEIEGVP